MKWLTSVGAYGIIYVLPGRELSSRATPSFGLGERSLLKTASEKTVDRSLEV
jgi:hypothetical protein